MIEVVYSGEEHEEQDEVRIPKNIHQIGNNSQNKTDRYDKAGACGDHPEKSP